MALFTSDDELTADAVHSSESAASGDARRPLLTRIGFGVGVAVTAALFLVGGWQRRWIADDGLIVLRTVRNLLAGNGPVFNIQERVETNTSAAWTFIVYFFSLLTDARLEYIVLTLALLLSAAAVVLAMLGSARLWGGSRAALMLPAGALVYIAIPPARDYASSGLESCLVIFWLALLWLLLVRWSTAEVVRLPGLLALVFTAGFGWLVRPEVAMVSVLVLLVVIFAPASFGRSADATPASSGRATGSAPGWLAGLNPWLQRALLAAVAGVFPVGYEIWRLGYYGLPFPNTAIAKDATGSKWGQGFTYLWNLVGPYWLLLPLIVLLLAALYAMLGSGGVRLRVPSARLDALRAYVRLDALRGYQQRLRSPKVVVGLMLFSGLLLTVYLLKVGGDFMHGRMMLPPLFCFLLPVMVLPLRLDRKRRDRLIPLVAFSTIVVWAAIAANASVQTHTIGRSGIVDERAFYSLNSGHAHPILAEDYLDYRSGWMRSMIKDIKATPNGALLVNGPMFTSWTVVPPPLPVKRGGAGHTVYFLNLGMTSMNVPLKVRVIDPEGLAYPLAAHSDRLKEGRIGHDKSLPADWVVSDLGMVNRHPWTLWYLDEDGLKEAEVALTCPETRKLVYSYRGPITVARWWQNFKHAFEFAKYRIDRVPQYEIERCHLPEPVLQKPRDN